MKSRAFCLLAAVSLVVGSPSLWAAQFGHFYYESTSTEISITGYTGPGGDVVMPTTIDGLPVTCIGGEAFYACSSLRSISIPDTVTSIGACAFFDCSSLTHIVIPHGVTSIPMHTFSQCVSLTSVTLGEGVTGIGEHAFDSCLSLTSIILPESVASLRSWAFSYCNSLTSVYCEGQAPALAEPVFSGTTNATVHYLPGTTGWGPTLAERPTALWIPIVPNLSSGPPDKPLRLVTHSPAPATVRVQRSANLVDWEDWQTVSRDEGPSELLDTEAGTTPYRFYRGVEE